MQLFNSAGCDSLASLNSTINQTSSSLSDITVCNNQLPFVWNGNSYTSTGLYTVKLQNEVGCDSLATLKLTVKAATSSTTNITVCSNQLPYKWNENNYSTAGTYTVNLVNLAGCDSTATLVLKVNSTSSSTTYVSVCSNKLPYQWNGNNYTAAGTYRVSRINTVGCDSVASLVLTVKAVTTSVTNATITQGQSYSFNGKVYTLTGTYNALLVNSVGCDSIATLNLVVTASPCNSNFVVTIPDAYATTKGVQPNTVYIGYTPAASITLTARPTGGNAPYTYKWSNGATTQSIRVNPTSAQTYSVTVTDKFGCKKTASKYINVVDIRCGNKNEKVVVCHVPPGKKSNPVTICISPSAVPAHLATGSYLGTCNIPSTLTRTMEPASEVELVIEGFSVDVFPNPSSTAFKLFVKSSNQTKNATMFVYDAIGRLLEKRVITVNQLILFGSSYRPGNYLVEVIQDNKKQNIKLIKL